MMQPTTPKQKLRWYQFSLRTLLIFVTLCAVPCSWLAVKMQRARRQRQAVEAILKLGKSVSYDYQYDSSFAYIQGAKPPGPAWLRKILGDDVFITVISVNPPVDIDSNQLFSDKNLECLKAFPQLRWLHLFGARITDAGLEHLKGLNQLDDLDLGQTTITDAGLQNLEGLTQLRKLRLPCTNVTDAGLNHLKGLAHLQELQLGVTKITDAGLENLIGMQQLEELALNDTRITDLGLEHLTGLKHLKLLILHETKVTDAGVAKLKKALPNLTIWRTH